MLLAAWLAAATKELEQANVATARLDCLVLLEDAIRKDRAWVLAHPEYELSKQQINTLGTALVRRAHHEPLAYIRGVVEFYGREFAVNPHVLVPRPESETMINLLKEYAPTKNLRIADIGTGSGALAITAHLELPKAHVTAIDIDRECLDVTKNNAQKHHIALSLFEGNLVVPLAQHYKHQSFVILANLPYVPNAYQINQAATLEPRLAIFGGVDGLDLYRQMFGQIKSLQLHATLIFTESLPPQHQELQHIAESCNYVPIAEDDFIQVFRPKLSA